MSAMLRVTDLEVRYGAVIAVQSLCIDLEVGKTVSIIGANGAGKSTTLLALTGLQKPSNGTIEVAGSKLTGKSARAYLGAGVCLVPEGQRNFGSLTVEENLMMPLVALRRKPEKRLFDLVYDLFPVLGERGSQRAGLLSGGEQKMLAIGRGLMLDPRLLIVDEPTLGLAPVAINAIRNALIALQSTGMTTIVAEQNVQFAEEMAGAVIVLERGHLIWTGGHEHLRSQPEVRHALLGEGGADRLVDARMSVSN